MKRKHRDRGYRIKFIVNQDQPLLVTLHRRKKKGDSGLKNSIELNPIVTYYCFFYGEKNNNNYFFLNSRDDALMKMTGDVNNR